ncbi:MAG: hypothetical protein MMC23_000523 [Stictis urceolatum]|nr:hypothetical protein [Stictis urceolata]
MDACGVVGQGHMNIRKSYHPDQIFSVVPNHVDCWGVFVNIFNDYPDLKRACSISTSSFNFAHLPCPPQSLRDWGTSQFIYDPVYAYAPMLAPPPDLIDLDPAWSTCTVDYGWDPYTALAPFPSLAVPTPDVPVTSVAAAPASLGSAIITPTPKPIPHSEAPGQPSSNNGSPFEFSDPTAKPSQALPTSKLVNGQSGNDGDSDGDESRAGGGGQSGDHAQPSDGQSGGHDQPSDNRSGGNSQQGGGVESQDNVPNASSGKPDKPAKQPSPTPSSDTDEIDPSQSAGGDQPQSAEAPRTWSVGSQAATAASAMITTLGHTIVFAPQNDPSNPETATNGKPGSPTGNTASKGGANMDIGRLIGSPFGLTKSAISTNPALTQLSGEPDGSFSNEETASALSNTGSGTTSALPSTNIGTANALPGPSSGRIVFDGTTIKAGEATTVDGTAVSMQSDGNIIVGTQSVDLNNYRAIAHATSGSSVTTTTRGNLVHQQSSSASLTSILGIANGTDTTARPDSPNEIQVVSAAPRFGVDYTGWRIVGLVLEIWVTVHFWQII